MSQDHKNIHLHTESYFFGSADEILLKKEAIKSKGGTESDFYPPFYQELLDILATVTRRSDCSKDVCNFLQEYTFETDLLKNSMKIENFSKHYKNINVTAKISKDIAIFFCLATNLNSAHFEDLVLL